MFKKKNNVDVITSLREASESAIRIFSSTVNKLESTNTEIDEVIEIKSSEILKLNEEKDTLTKIKSSNTGVILKIKSFIDSNNEVDV